MSTTIEISMISRNWLNVRIALARSCGFSSLMTVRTPSETATNSSPRQRGRHPR